MTKWPRWTYIFACFPLVGFYLYVRPKNFGKIFIIDKARQAYKMDYQDYRNLRLKEYLDSLGYNLNKIETRNRLEELSNLCYEQYKRYKPRPVFVFYTAALGAVFAVVQPFVAKAVAQSTDLFYTAVDIGLYLSIILFCAYSIYQWISNNPLDPNRKKNQIDTIRYITN